MGLFDDLLEEDELTQQPVQPQSQSRKGGLFDDLLEEDDIAPATQQPAAQPAYQYDPSGFRRKKPVSPEAQKEIGTLEGIANAARNAFDSSRQALDIVGDVTPEEAKNIAKIEFDKQSRKLAPGYDEYQKAEGFDAVLAFAKNPIEVTSNIVAEGLAGSLPALGAGLAAGGVGAAIGAPTVIGAPIGFTAGQVAGTFAGSLATEYGSKILEEMQEGGVDLTKPESIQGFFENEEAVAKARDKAISRGIPVAAFDAISAGIGGKLGRVIGKQFLTKTGEAAAELGVQAGLGGGGEVAGALVAGEPIEGKAVFGEVIGEAGPGAAEIITGRMADRAARVKAEEEKKIKAAAQLSDNLERNDAPLTAAAVKSTTATTIEQDKLAAQLEEQLDANEIASQVSGQLAVTKEPTAAPPAIKSKEEFTAIYSQVSPEELDAAEAGFTNTLATAATEEGRISAQNALEAIKEVKATVTPPAPTVEPTITPAVTPAVPTAQPPITDATQEIIQPEGVRQEPQDRVEGETPAETIARNRILGAARGQEEGQVVPTTQPTISEIPPTSELVGAEPTQPTIREVPEISPIVGAEPAAIVEQEPVATAEQPFTTTTGDAEIDAKITKTETMSPDEYLRQAWEATDGKLGGSYEEWLSSNKLTDADRAKYSQAMMRGDKFPLPYIDKYGGSQDGRNRALAAKEAGIQTIPVGIIEEPSVDVQIQDLRNELSITKSKIGRSRIQEKISKLESTSAPVEEVEFAELRNLMEMRGQAQSKVKGVKFSKKDEARYNELLPKYRSRLFETITPEADPVVWKDIQGNDIKVSQKGTFYTVENGRVRTGPAFQSEGFVGDVSPQPVSAAVVESNNVPLPEGYTKQGDVYVYQAPAVSETITPAAEGISVGNRIKLGKSPQTYTIEEVIPQSATERELGEQYYSVKNERTGETQVVEARDLKQVKGKGARKIAAATIDTTPENILTTPPDQQYTFNEVFDVAYDMFGGEIPEGFTIVNDSTDKDFEFKAAYIPESGEIIVNLAYLNKSDDIRDTITHELGHYIFGDPEFRAAFDQFIASLSPEARADLDAYVETAYNKETGEIRLEEKMVRAFVDQFLNEEQAPAWRSMLDAIKRFLNKLGFKFNISDRDAISVFTAALDRYKAGEAISREGGARLMAAEPAPKRRKEQVGGAEREETRYITTPKGILSMNTDVLREKFFDGTSVSPEKTTQAWGYISRLLDIKSGNANEFAGEINDTVIAELEARRDAAIAAGEDVDPDENLEERIGAAMFSVELMNYAGKLAEQGDQRMLKFMIRNVNSMPVDKYAGGISDLAIGLRTRLEYDVSGFGAYNADQKGKVERTAAVMFGTNKPNEDQFNTVKDALDKSEKTELGNPEEVAGDIENVEKRTGKSVVKKIEEKIKASTAPKKEELLISFQNLNQDRKFAGINIVYKPQKIDPAKNIQNLIIGKLVDYRKTLIKQGADGLESTFWQTMSNKERKPGPLGEIDQAQNNELANIVQKTLIDLGMKGEPPNTKMTDIEKVASILNKQLLGEEKKIAADKRVVEEIERRRSTELEGASDADAVNAKYDAILNAWNEAMSRQTNMPISDNMLQRLINSELKEQGSNVTELINEPYEDVLSQKKKGIVDSIIRRVYGVSKEAETGIEISEDYDNLSRYLKQTLENMLKMQAEKRDAAVARTLQRGLGDLPALPEVQKNKAQTIVQQDLRQQPDMGRREPWQNMLVGKLTQAGVAPEQAENIANLVWRQHEINDANRKIKEMKTAAEKGSLAVIIDRIKNTSLEKQQSPEWKQDVIKEYLRDAGLSSQAAETAAKLYDSIISERLAAAKQKAFEDTLAKSAPWKNYASRNGKLAKDALKKIKEAIRAGVLDPEKNAESIIAALNGWTGFTKEQYQRIVQIDTILNDPEKDDITKREAMDELNRIISKAKLPVSAREAIGPYYVGQALGGIPTATVNVASPIGFSIRNLMVDISKYAATDPAKIPIAFESFLDSMRSWYNQTAYAYKNQIYLNDVVEYLNGQNVLRELFDKGKQQWAEGKYAEGLKNMAIGMMQITGRVLSALDQGAISMLENQNITRYAMAALENAKDKVPKNKIREFANMTLDLKRRVITENIAAGMDKNRAVVLADLAVKSEIRAALSEFGVSYKDVLDSAVNDALQSVGRNKVITIEGVKKVQQDISDSGFLSYPPIKFLEWIASSAGKGGPAMQIFSKMVYGFALIPARTFSTAAWFSPYGFLRLAIDKYNKNKGQESPYAMSLQTEAQFKQRLTDSIAGSIVMLALFAMRSGSSDDEDDKLFKIVITGNGPNATTDKQYYDTWIKNHKPYSIELHFGDSKATINIGRGGEALFFPIMLAGALDDWEIKKKQNLTKKEPSDLNIATELLGSAFFALAQRGPYAAFTEPLFDASKQGRVTENLVGQLGYFGKTFIPVLGTSITRNISDFINDPVDRSSIEGALYANTPIVGPWIGTKALNALGQPIRADDFSDKLFKLGVPVVFSFPKNTPENALNEIILKQGSGPTIPTRSNAQKRFGDVLTDKEFEAYVREYGRVMSDKMFKNRTRLANMKSSDYDDELEKYARGYSIDGIKIKGASDSAVLAVKRMRQ